MASPELMGWNNWGWCAGWYTKSTVAGGDEKKALGVAEGFGHSVAVQLRQDPSTERYS
jgi:hypothetical protein